MKHFLPVFHLIVLVLSAEADTLSIFSARNIVSQTRGWNGPKDASATVTLGFENDSLVVKAVVNDDQLAPGREISDIDQGDRIDLWLRFPKKPNLRLTFSPGRAGKSEPASVLRDGSGRLQTLEATPPTVAWSSTGYELDAIIPLADLRLDPDVRPQSWAATLGDCDLEPGPSVSILRDMQKELRFFVSRCHEAGMKIVASEPVVDGELDSRVAQLIRYQQDVRPHERFDAILFDLTALDIAAVSGDLSSRLSDHARDWRREFRNSEVWAALSLKPGKPSGSKAKPMDFANQMIFRTEGSAQQQLSETMKTALQLEGTTARPFWLGIDVRPGKVGNAQLEESMGRIASNTGGISAFQGFALDNYRAYRKLTPGDLKPGSAGAKLRAVWIGCNGGLLEGVMTNDYFQKDFFKFVHAPFGERDRKITHILMEAGRFTRGPAGTELLLRSPEKFDPAEPNSWAPYK